MRRLVLLLAACGTPPSVSATGTRVMTEDALFRQEPRWLGGDGAYTIDLGDDRTLWLFGDSFIATSPALVRTESTMVRNSVAVMTGRDPATATMQFAWRDGSPPASLFAEDGDHWFWPSDGVRVPGGPLVVFLSEERATPGDGLGFAAVGFRAVSIDPSGPPASWQPAPIVTVPAPYDPTASVACSAVDGDYLVALFTDTDAHHGRFARWPLASLPALGAPAWWDGAAWGDTAAIALDDGASECSLSQLADGTWLHVASRGFGATTIAIRTAPAIEGPWSDPEDVFTPPESSRADAFVYAGKAHPGLVTHAGNLVVTYADNSFSFSDLLDPTTTLYWPHVAELDVQ